MMSVPPLVPPARVAVPAKVLLLELARIAVLADLSGAVAVRDGLRGLMVPLRTEVGMSGPVPRRVPSDVRGPL